MKRATVYFDEGLHKALRIKSLESDRSISDLVNDAIRESLNEDLEDLESIETRRNEPTISYADFLKELKDRGQL